MDPPWGNGIAACLGLLVLMIVVIVLGGRIAVQRYRGTPPPLWAILYGVALFFALIAFNVWWFVTRH